jgi:hypothetical protein
MVRPTVAKIVATTTSDAQVVETVVNTARYPLAEPAGDGWRQVVSAVRAELGQSGCSVLPDFVQPERLPALRQECATIAPLAHYDVATVNAYNIDVKSTSSLPPAHPGRISMRRGNAFVAGDRVPPHFAINQLYRSPLFQRFLASCFEQPRVHELADPLAGLTLNVVRPGMEHPWHFDTNELAVSLLTQQPQAGGEFEYCPDIRSADAENFADVRAVLVGDDAAAPLVRRLSLRPGDLQLFKGRYSLHRVRPVAGTVDRHSAIFAYTERPGVVGNVARTKQLFGRVLPEHLAAEGRAVRADGLLD